MTGTRAIYNGTYQLLCRFVARGPREMGQKGKGGGEGGH